MFIMVYVMNLILKFTPSGLFYKYSLYCSIRTLEIPITPIIALHTECIAEEGFRMESNMKLNLYDCAYGHREKRLQKFSLGEFVALFNGEHQENILSGQ